MSQRTPQAQRCKAHPQRPARELRQNVKHSVPALDFAESQERQGDRRVQVGAGPLPPRE